MKTKELTLKQKSSVSCPFCGVAAGKRCVLVGGDLRNEAHAARKLLAAETLERNQEAIIKGRVSVPKKKESNAAVLARVRKELAGPYLAKSVRDKALRKQIALSIEKTTGLMGSATRERHRRNG